MKTSLMRPLVLSAAALALFAACSSSTGSTWTIAPALPTSTAGASAAASVSPTAVPITSAVPASPATSGAPASTATSGAPASPAAESPGAGQVVKLELTGSLSITQDGQQVSELTVKEGETVHFVVDNVAGFTHNFHIGTPDQLTQAAPDLPGIPDWTDGVQEFDYVVTADTANLQFSCTVPGHYAPMHGTFKVVP